MNNKLVHPFLEGDKVYLRGLEKSDLQTNYFQWLNDQEVTRNMSVSYTHLDVYKRQY